MPGELGNCMAGRIANLFNFRGPNYVVDAACASAMAAIDASIEGLIEREYDVVVTGGIDRNMGASTYVKFCEIGALSATGTRPYADGADGFVMGEGAALFVLKRLGRRRARRRPHLRRDPRHRGLERRQGQGHHRAQPDRPEACRRAGVAQVGVRSRRPARWSRGTAPRPASATWSRSRASARRSRERISRPGSVALGSVKSNIGHLKGAAGAAGHPQGDARPAHKVLPPSLNFERPNPNIDWSATPVRGQHRAARVGGPGRRHPRAGVSAFGFGGTNFHAVLEEHVPGRLNGGGRCAASPMRR